MWPCTLTHAASRSSTSVEAIASTSVPAPTVVRTTTYEFSIFHLFILCTFAENVVHPFCNFGGVRTDSPGYTRCRATPANHNHRQAGSSAAADGLSSDYSA